MGRRGKKRQTHEKKPHVNAARPSLPSFLESVDKEYILYFSLDGEPMDVLRSYIKYVRSVWSLGFKRGLKIDATKVFGTHQRICTTPIEGAVYVVVQLGNLLAVFVIKGDEWWLKGYYLGNKAIEFDPGTEGKQYIKGSVLLNFTGNHYRISEGDPGSLYVGHESLVVAVKDVILSNGRPKRTSLGVIETYLCEGPRLKEAYDALKLSLVLKHVSRLEYVNSLITMLIRQWQTLSFNLMHYIRDLEIGETPKPLRAIFEIPGSDSPEWIVSNVKMLYVNALKQSDDIAGFGMPSGRKGGGTTQDVTLASYYPPKRHLSTAGYWVQGLSTGLIGTFSRDQVSSLGCMVVLRRHQTTSVFERSLFQELYDWKSRAPTVSGQNSHRSPMLAMVSEATSSQNQALHSGCFSNLRIHQAKAASQ
ncbi:hypothetical protein VPH35_050334 [Triticum aestivum]|uniref:uncharacterized protein n=1 Tax=Triticum aestivum TaxID=4565 RepID=UPI001D01A78F|nr:uncharacterized protein LOC123064988 [Triticum aestivum]